MGMRMIKVKNVEETILREENITALKLWADQNKIIARTLRQIVNAKSDNKRFSFTEIVSQYLKIRKYAIIEITYLEEQRELVEYFDLFLKIGEMIKPRISMTKTEFRKVNWGFSFFSDESNRMKEAGAIVIKDKGLNYILAFSVNSRANQIVILCHADKKEECAEHCHNFFKANNLNAHRIFLYSGYDFTIKNPSFKKIKGIFSDAVNSEIMLLEHFIGTEKRRNVLFYGPAGTGKTTAVEQLMQVALKRSVRVVIATSGQNLAELYEKIPKPALIILEDFDLFNQERGTYQGVSSNTLQALSTEHNGVITIATSNNVSGLDKASVRSGRVDKAFLIDYPLPQHRVDIAEIIASLNHVTATGDLLDFCRANKITGAIIESIIKEKQAFESMGVEKTFKDIIADYQQYSLNTEFAQTAKVGF